MDNVCVAENDNAIISLKKLWSGPFKCPMSCRYDRCGSNDDELVTGYYNIYSGGIQTHVNMADTGSVFAVNVPASSSVFLHYVFK